MLSATVAGVASPVDSAPGKCAMIALPAENPSASLKGSGKVTPPLEDGGMAAADSATRRPVGVSASALVKTLDGKGSAHREAMSGSHSRVGHSAFGSTGSMEPSDASAPASVPPPPPAPAPPLPGSPAGSSEPHAAAAHMSAASATHPVAFMRVL